MHILRHALSALESQPGVTTALLGIGSPLGADRAGWDAVDALAADSGVQARLRAGTLVLQKLDRPGVALLDALRGFERVILLDAVIAPGYAPNTYLELQRDELALLATPASTHGIGVAEALALGEALGLLPAALEIWGVVVAPEG